MQKFCNLIIISNMQLKKEERKKDRKNNLIENDLLKTKAIFLRESNVR